MTARKHQALGKGLGALFPSGRKEREAAKPLLDSTDYSTPGGSNETPTVEIKKAIQETNSDICVQEIPLEKIRANRCQPRQDFDESALEELKESIMQHGVLQPILVRRLPALDGYEIVAGERRFRAAKLAKLVTVPAIVRSLNDAASTVIALIENLQREDLNAVEEARAYQNLLQNFSLTQEALAERVGRSRSHITNMLRILKLDPYVQEYLANGSLTMGQVRPLVVLTDDELQKEAADIIMAHEYSARQVEELIKRMQKTATKSDGKKQEEQAVFLQEAEDKLKIFFGTQVRIRTRGKKKRIEIDFSSEDELNSIIESLLERKNQIVADKRAALHRFSAGGNFTV